MRFLTRFAVTFSLGALLLGACSNQIDEPPQAAADDAFKDASGVPETVTASL